MIKTRFGIFDKDTGKKLTYKEIEEAYRIRSVKDFEIALKGRYNETIYIGRHIKIKRFDEIIEIMEEKERRNIKVKVLENAERVYL